MSEVVGALPTSPGRRQALRLALVAGLATLLTGCAPPVPFYTPTRLRHGTYGRGSIPREGLAFLTMGTTTRTEVLLRLGLPSEVGDDDRQFVYTWAVEVAAAGVAWVASAVWVRVERHRLLMEFDETGILRKHDHQITVAWEEDKPRPRRR